MGLIINRYICIMNKQLTFGGYPVEMELIGDVVQITCKGVTGTDKQVEIFLKNKSNGRYKFGESNIRKYPKKIVRIDCLKDTKAQMEFLYEQAQLLKDE